MIKEKPILFSTPMVQAILNTEPNTWPAKPIDPKMPFKCVTRRVIKTPPCEVHEHGNMVSVYRPRKFKDEEARFCPHDPYCKEDILWVREKFQICPASAFLGIGAIKPFVKIPKKKPESYYIEFAADNEKSSGERWRPSIHLPQYAARIFLEIKKVSVGRLQDIGDKDAHKEGMDSPSYPIIQFKDLWQKLNEKRGYSWETNPWVWVIEFMRVEK